MDTNNKENSDENSLGRFMSITAVRNMFIVSMVTFFAYLYAIFAINFQKGMIFQMGFGNMNGNYSIEELSRSVYLAARQFIHDEGYGTDFPLILASVIFLMLVLSVIIFVSVFCVHKLWGLAVQLARCVKDKSNTSPDKGSRYEKSKEFQESVQSGVYSFLTGYAVITFFSVIFLGAIFISSIGNLGFSRGMSYIEKHQKKFPCVLRNELQLEKGDIVHQCAQKVIGDTRFTTWVLLETLAGQFVATREAYLYLSKDGSECTYSRYEKHDPDDKKEGFEKTNLEYACDVVHIRNGVEIIRDEYYERPD